MENIVAGNTNHLINDHPVVYFSKPYIIQQRHPDFIGYRSDKFELLITHEHNQAISIPGSPFGSIYCYRGAVPDDFKVFLQQVLNDLASRNINSLTLKHPPTIYNKFIDIEWLSSSGFLLQFTDINQYITLDGEWEGRIHKMQERKLKDLRIEGFEFRKMETDELKMAHQFVEACRKAQGTAINISYELLRHLNDATDRYDCFCIEREGKVSSLAIMIRSTPGIVYYYLPATAPTFRSRSPMVLLIAEMVSYYHQKGLKFIDLGVSSIEGKPQESLRIFKNRMGAIETGKETWKLNF